MPFDVQDEEEGKRMNWKRTARWSWLILPFLLLAVGIGVAAADHKADHKHNQVLPPPDPAAKDCANLAPGLACIYETTQNAKFTGEKFVRRISTAAAQGKVGAGSPICHPYDMTKPACDITIMATDKISTTTGKGPIEGTFAIVVHEITLGAPTAEPAAIVVLKGFLRGEVDISAALLHNVPLGSIIGRWETRDGRSGTFTGTLRFAFGFGPDKIPGTTDDFLNPECVLDADLTDCVIAGPYFYFDAASFDPVVTGVLGIPVRMVGNGPVFNEMVLGRPTLLFEIAFQ